MFRKASQRKAQAQAENGVLLFQTRIGSPFFAVLSN